MQPSPVSHQRRPYISLEGGTPPRGVLDRKLSEFNDLDGAIAAKSSF
jgi:hypothetical protein